jgi:Hydrazine synthase alpha subunit middle domain
MTIQAHAEKSLGQRPVHGTVRVAHRVAMGTCACICALILSACGGGGGKDEVRIGSGQSGGETAPTAVDFPIFYVKRPVPDFTKTVNTQDIRRERQYLVGADLFMRDRPSPSAKETNITTRVTAGKRYDVKDVDTSWDGKKIIFSMRGPLKQNQKDVDPPTWEIWEYVLATDDLHRVVVSDVTAADGNDVSPHYLADDRILFTSTRQRDSKAILIDESSQGIGSSGYEAQDESNGESAFVVHVMDADGTNIHQVTFNQSHDRNPTLMQSGKLLFSRWDHANNRNAFNLYTANPDGTDLELLYGAQSHNSGSSGSTIQFVDAREMSNGKILTMVRPFTGTEFGGDLYIIDTANYVENNQPTLANQGMTGPAQTKALQNDIRTVPGPSPGGRFNSAFPLFDGSNGILTTWTQCRLLDMKSSNAIVPCTASGIADASQLNPTQYMLAPPLYSAWLFDPSSNTLRPIMQPEEGVMVSDIAAAQPRDRQALIRDHVPGIDADANLVSEGVGILNINSVYDFDGKIAGGTTSIAAVSPGGANYAVRPARFLRIEKAVSLPNRDVRDVSNAAFGPTGRFMRQILGYIPIEPDGSVRAKVPANVAFQISVTDANGRRLNTFSRHNAWLQLRPGEEVTCNGCHTPTAQVAGNGTTPPSGVSHGRLGLFAKAYSGSTAGGTFASSNATFIAAGTGDTMAKARADWSCGNEQCASVTPSVNLLSADVWPIGNDPHGSVPAPVVPPATTPVDRPADIAIRYIGGGGLKTKLPTSSSCATTWSSLCRIVINYLEHVQPMWDLTRPVLDPVTGMPIQDANGVDLDNKCSSCHSRLDAANANRVPAGFLELTGDLMDNDPDHVTSYNQLLFAHDQLMLMGTALVQVCAAFGDPDPVTNIAPCVQFAQSPGSMTAGSAGASTRFFSKMTANGGTVDHSKFMSAGELKLVSEWLDIGAQYYNDPFKAPEN